MEQQPKAKGAAATGYEGVRKRKIELSSVACALGKSSNDKFNCANMVSPLDMPWGGAASVGAEQILYGSPFISKSLRYQKDQTSGTLMKESNTHRYFSKKQTRFVILDHKSGVMKIYSENNLMSQFKSINYSDVALMEVVQKALPALSQSQERQQS